MPTYSYRCPNCGLAFDRFHSMSCSDPQNCPECGAEGKKLMSATSVIFKGSGFYSTDYRDSGYLEAKKQETTNTSDSKTDKKASTTKSEPTNTSDSTPSTVTKSDTVSTKAA